MRLSASPSPFPFDCLPASAATPTAGPLSAGPTAGGLSPARPFGEYLQAQSALPIANVPAAGGTIPAAATVVGESISPALTSPVAPTVIPDCVGGSTPASTEARFGASLGARQFVSSWFVDADESAWPGGAIDVGGEVSTGDAGATEGESTEGALAATDELPASPSPTVCPPDLQAQQDSLAHWLGVAQLATAPAQSLADLDLAIGNTPDAVGLEGGNALPGMAGTAEPASSAAATGVIDFGRGSDAGPMAVSSADRAKPGRRAVPNPSAASPASVLPSGADGVAAVIVPAAPVVAPANGGMAEDKPSSTARGTGSPERSVAATAVPRARFESATSEIPTSARPNAAPAPGGDAPRFAADLPPAEPQAVTAASPATMSAEASPAGGVTGTAALLAERTVSGAAPASADAPTVNYAVTGVRFAEADEIVRSTTTITRPSVDRAVEFEATAGAQISGAAVTTDGSQTTNSDRVGAVRRSVAPRSGGAEKIAAPANARAISTATVSEAEQKHILAADKEDVTQASKRIGTNAAETQLPMPPSASTTPLTYRLSEPPTLAAPALTFDALVKDATLAGHEELGRAAHRAVDSALAMADHFTSSGAQRGVSLQFSVSGVDLAVRVEMRADGVHTVFRTDSPELRAALAQEWQTMVTAQPADRAQRLADPVFTSTPGATTTSSDSGASHRDPQNRQEPSAPPAPRSAASAVRTPVVTPSSVKPAARAVPLSTTRHLHTFA